MLRAIPSTLSLSTLLLCGCSPTFMTPPPSGGAAGVARPNVDCTSSYAWPVVDTVLGAYQLGGVVYAATLDDSRYDGYPISRRTDMAIGASLAAVFAASATYGYITASRCRRIQQGPPGGSYVPGISEATPAPHTARLHSAPGGSEMGRRPDPTGADWKR